jgi:Flp pilus assembly protein TadD
LYRTGDYSDALRALQKLGTFLRGEEDLRFYKAVALYEIGRYDEAKKELACALPYIQMTEDVSRYQTKIEQTTR